MLPFFLSVAAGGSENLRLQDVAPGVVAFLQPQQARFNDSNAVFIVRSSDVVVVDSQNTPRATREAVALLQARTDLPVKYVVNTHWHGDHIQGNSAWLEAYPTVEFIAHASVPEDVKNRGNPQRAEQVQAWREAVEKAEALLALPEADADAPPAEERARLRDRLPRWRERLAELRQIPIVFPTVLLKDDLTLSGGGRQIQIFHQPGHTEGDLAVYLPTEKVLITGDLVDDLPFGGHGSPVRWLESLRKLESLDFEWMIPGHGSVRAGKDHLRLIRRMVETLLEQVRIATKDGKNLEETQSSVDLGAFREALAGEDPAAQRAFDDFIPATIEQAWKELQKK